MTNLFQFSPVYMWHFWNFFFIIADFISSKHGWASLSTHQVSLNWTHALIQMLYIILVFWNSLQPHISCCNSEEKCWNCDCAVLICFTKQKILPLINAARQTEWRKKHQLLFHQITIEYLFSALACLVLNKWTLPTSFVWGNILGFNLNYSCGANKILRIRLNLFGAPRCLQLSFNAKYRRLLTKRYGYLR